MIELVRITKRYGNTQVVSDLSLEVASSEKLVILGTSGSGKSTTLKMINRLVEPSEGSILVDGEDITKSDPVKVRRSMGYVIQSVGLFPHYTVAQNLSLIPELLKWAPQKTEDRIDELLESVHLPLKFKEKLPDELSGGQQQRVGFARAIAAYPQIILMDEPFGALDPITRSSIQDDFITLEEFQDKTVVMVTHDVQEAFKLGDKIGIMDQGELLTMGKPRDLLYSRNDFVSSFIGAESFQLKLKSIKVRDIIPYLHKTEAKENSPSLLIETPMESIFQANEDQDKNISINGEHYGVSRSQLIEAFYRFDQQMQKGS